MALKALILRKKIDAKKKELETLRAKDADFEKRAAELTAAIEEAQSEEDTATVEEMASAFEAEQAGHEDAKAALEREIGELEEDLQNEERKQDTTPKEPEKRKEVAGMNTRSKVFAKMSVADREAMFAREDVKGWLQETRNAMQEKRALTNVGLTIPDVFLGLLRENLENYSKLYKHVNVRALSGEGRMVIMGTIPEAIWTDCCANLNELDLNFNDVEINCWKVGGYFAVCNATLEDSDIDLAGELLTAIGQAIGLALDKAILYGTGSRMPLGIVTRLAQTSQPGDYPATARDWVDLHTSNIRSISAEYTGVNLYAQIALASGYAKGKYARGEKVWIMNETTYTKLIAEAMSMNAAGAIVTGIGGTMPVIGGIIEVLNFIPNNVIIGGYFELYLLGERAGKKFATSEHVRFLQDQTVFKGTARYDGQPVIAEAFVAIGLAGTTPNATMTFAPDYANTDMNTLTVVAAAGSAAGKTVLTVTNTVAQSNPVLKYKIGNYAADLAVGDTVTGYTDLTSGTTAITAAAGTIITVAELDAAGKVVSAGTVASVPKTT